MIIFKSMEFWKSLSILVAAGLYQLGYVEFADAAKILGVALAVLNFFNITPELRARNLI